MVPHIDRNTCGQHIADDTTDDTTMDTFSLVIVNIIVTTETINITDVMITTVTTMTNTITDLIITMGTATVVMTIMITESMINMDINDTSIRAKPNVDMATINH